jgi:hypothetical protein
MKSIFNHDEFVYVITQSNIFKCDLNGREVETVHGVTTSCSVFGEPIFYKGLMYFYHWSSGVYKYDFANKKTSSIDE